MSNFIICLSVIDPSTLELPVAQENLRLEKKRIETLCKMYYLDCVCTNIDDFPEEVDRVLNHRRFGYAFRISLKTEKADSPYYLRALFEAVAGIGRLLGFLVDVDNLEKTQ